MAENKTNISVPGICLSWEDVRKELPEINGDEELFKRVWEDNEALSYMYIWHLVLSF